MFPELISTKFITIHTLWIFVAIALIVTTIAIINFSKSNGLKIQFLSDRSLQIVLSGLIAGRILGVAENYYAYFYEFSFDSLLRTLYFWDQTISATGFIIGMLVYLYFACKKNEQDFLKWLDALAPAILIGLAIGHLGEFFAGINYGRETGLPWGVNFESPAIKYTVPIHPTQIYAFLYSSALAAFIVWFSKHKKIVELEKDGLIGGVAILSYSLLQFLENFLRGDDTVTLLGIRIPQVLFLITAILAGVFLYLRYNKPTKKTFSN